MGTKRGGFKFEGFNLRVFFLNGLFVWAAVFAADSKWKRRSLVTIVSETDVLRSPEKSGGRNEKHAHVMIKSLPCTFTIIKPVLLRKAAL